MKVLSCIAMLSLLFPTLSLYGQELIELQPYTRQYTLTGISSPRTTLKVSAEVGGRVEDVLVDVGDSVTGNGLVAQLDTTFINLDREKNSIEQQLTRRQLDLERKTSSRYQSLITQNSAAQATYDEAQARADVLELRLRSLENERIRLDEQLQRHALTGPPGWLVIERFAEPGQYLSQGQAVAELGDFETVIVTYLLTIEELDLLGKTDPLTLFFPERDLVVDAAVYRVSPDVDKKSRKIVVDLLVRPTGLPGKSRFRGGLRAELSIVGQEESDIYQVPASALRSKYEASWLTTAAGREIRVIVLGRSDDHKHAIISGDQLSRRERYRLHP
jgi:RND family efflux transporter MFP subunit